MIRRVCVTGGAGFIGSNLVDELISRDIKVRIVDNFRTGRPEFVNPQAELFQGDIFDRDLRYRAFDGCDWICHLQANADVRHGLERSDFDHEQNTLATQAVVNAMIHVGVSKIFFSSTASVYGGIQMERIPEDAPFPIQESLYGTSKVACEGILSTYAGSNEFTSVVGRWVQIVGERYLHGHVIDFVRKLLRNPDELYILGDGQQRKSGLYVKDLARGIADLIAVQDLEFGGSFEAFNLGTNETFTVDESADLISNLMGVTPKYTYSGRKKGGWVGDNPHVLLDTTKIKNKIGWQPTLTIPEAIERTVHFLRDEKVCNYL